MLRQGLRPLIDEINIKVFPKVEIKQIQGLFMVMSIEFCIWTQNTVCLTETVDRTMEGFPVPWHSNVYSKPHGPVTSDHSYPCGEQSTGCLEDGINTILKASAAGDKPKNRN